MSIVAEATVRRLEPGVRSKTTNTRASKFLTCGCFAKVSTAELRQADRIAGDILDDLLLVKAKAEDPRITKLRDLYKKALRKVLESKFKRFESVGFKGTVADMMVFAEFEFGPDFTKKMAPAVIEHLRTAFQLGQRMKVVPDSIATLWDKPRKEAVDWLAANDRFWLGKVFPEHLSNDFRDTIVEGMEQGLGRKEIGARLREMVLGKPGMPAKQEYYNRVAAASVNRARNWGGMFSLHSAGFTEYEIRAVLDEKTSAICRMMSGKVFRVRDAMDLINRTLEAEPADIETLAPWPRYDHERDDHYLTIDGEKEYLSGKSSSWLAGHGLSLPPYHGSCRSTFVVTHAQIQEHREVIQPAAPPFDVNELNPVRMRLDGMHEKKVFEDKEGGRWLFKPVSKEEEFRAWGDRAAANLAEKLGLPTPDVYITEMEGRPGSLQRLFDVAGNFRGVNPTALTPDELAHIQREHIFDWLISNHDGHPGNLVRLKDGRLVGIDKGQMFRFFGKDKLSVGYNPNPEVSLYNDVFKAYSEGKEVGLLDIDHGDIERLLKKIDDLPDDEFKRILSPYAKRAAEAGKLAYKTEEAFLAKALERKHSLRKQLKEFYDGLAASRKKALGKVIGAAPFREIDTAFVKKVKQSGTMGQSLMVAGDDFENMNLLVYEVQGKGLFIEGKLRAQSQSKLLQRLGIDAGVEAVDPYWERVLKVAKSYNHHLGPGGDGKVPEHTLKLWKELIGELKKDTGERATSYRKYLRSLAKERRGKVTWGKTAVGEVVEKYSPPKRPLPGKLSRYTAKTTVGWDYKKEARAGRVRLSKGRRTFSGTAYDVDLGEGVKLHYIQHGDGNRFSKQGKFRLEVPKDTPGGIRKALRKLEELGLDARLASDEDLEYLYLSKVSYAAGVSEKVGVTPEMTIRQRINAHKDFWEKKLDVKDLRELANYSPMPRFDEGKGWARWTRFDIDEDEFERRMKGFVLGHDTHQDTAGALDAILDSKGSLTATEEKFRVGVAIKGMSPQEDQRTGGASYVFTRIAGAGKAGRFDLVFDKRLLLDPDTVSYGSDHYGRVEPDFLKTHRKRGIPDWLTASKTSSNETLIRNHLPLSEYLNEVNVGSEAERRKVLRIFEKHGVRTIRGRRVEDLVHVR